LSISRPPTHHSVSIELERLRYLCDAQRAEPTTAAIRGFLAPDDKESSLKAQMGRNANIDHLLYPPIMLRRNRVQ
jgi:hypothetical protein